MPPPRKCKDCPPELNRPTPRPGPRCSTCWTAELVRRREAEWEKHIRDTYRLTPEKYWAIYKKQSGACAICQRAKGRPQNAPPGNRAKRLSVDHDHRCCKTTPTCGKCTRGLLDSTCNKRVLGHLRDDPEAFIRGAEYLKNPPAREILDGEFEACDAE